MPRELILRTTLDEIMGHRNNALDLFELAFQQMTLAAETMDEASKAVVRACGGVHSDDWFPHGGQSREEINDFDSALKLPDPDKWARVAKRITDLRVWASIIERTDLKRLMDKQSKEQLRKQLRYIAPEFDGATYTNKSEVEEGFPELDVDTVEATLQGFREDAGMIFKRGIANVFTRLSKRFKSHDGFSIGSRLILTRVVDESGHWYHSNYHRESLLDIERVFLVLDGKKAEDQYTGICDIVNEERKGGWGARVSEHEGDYFKLRIFKNGNAHLWFKRPELVERVNKILAEWYGEVLGFGKEYTETEEEILSDRTMTVARNFGAFNSPPDVVSHVLGDIRYKDESLRILEPSAGTGNFAYELAKPREHWHTEGTFRDVVDCIEIQPELAQELKDSRKFSRVTCADFLSIPSECDYDLIVMNPPFDRQRDIDHVSHAFNFLKVGGTLTAVMSAGTEFRENAKAKAFRSLMKKHRATWRDLPACSFASEGTNVNTCYVTVTKREV